MDLHGTYTFDAPAARVWDLLMDTGQIAACVPGCDRLEPIGDDRYKATLTVALAAVTGTYDGTVALVDKQRKPRPDAKAARIYVRGAKLGAPPPATVHGVRQLDDHGKAIVQATVKNEAHRGGNIMVIASFYGPDGKPMTRPFSMLWVDRQAEQPVQFVGPPGSVRGTVFIGDVAY